MRRLFGGAPGTAAPAPEPAVPAREAADVIAAGSTAVACFRVTTADGAFLTVSGEGADQAVLTTRPALDAAHAAVALVPATLPHACFLVAPDMRVFDVAGDVSRGAAVSGRLLQTDTRGIVRFKYPLGSQGFLGTGQTPAELRFDAPGDTMQAAFRLAPLALGDLPVVTRAAVAEIGAAASEGLRAAPLLARLRAGSLRPELAESLVRLMPWDELEELARRLLHDGADLALLRRAMPADGWLGTALPAMAAWLSAGRPEAAGHLLVSPPEDEAPMLPAMGQGVVPAGLALHGLARRHVLPRRTACLLATARNEGPYLLDWISYHLSIGFEHIFLYTNDNQDGSDALLSALARNGVVTLIQNARGPAAGPQAKAYTHALTLLPQILDFRWTCILDLDEYLAFNAEMFDSVIDFIGFHEAQPVDAIALCWAMFAAMPGEVWRDRSSPARMTRRTRDINVHVKSLFRTRLFWFAQPHFPTPTLDAPFHYRTQEGHVHHHPGVKGRIAAFAETPSASQGWVNHYMLRTADEALWKWSRGRGDWLAHHFEEQSAWFLDFVSRTFLDLARPEHLVEDRRILDCAKGQGAVLDRLLSLPGVAVADAEVKRCFAAQLEKTTGDFLSLPIGRDAPETLRHFRELVVATRKKELLS